MHTAAQSSKQFNRSIVAYNLTHFLFPILLLAACSVGQFLRGFCEGSPLIGAPRAELSGRMATNTTTTASATTMTTTTTTTITTTATITATTTTTTATITKKLNNPEPEWRSGMAAHFIRACVCQHANNASAATAFSWQTQPSKLSGIQTNVPYTWIERLTPWQSPVSWKDDKIRAAGSGWGSKQWKLPPVKVCFRESISSDPLTHLRLQIPQCFSVLCIPKSAKCLFDTDGIIQAFK